MPASSTRGSYPTERVLENFIGDGAGVGKSRTIAGIILKNYQLGRKKAVLVSDSLDLKYDVVRNLKDIGAVGQINVHALNNIKYGHVMAKGIVFETYAFLRSASQSGEHLS